ncbi:MAG: hypothetical protein AAF208_12520 [Cyanobacteria bacterium P01_A01_bin.45]
MTKKNNSESLHSLNDKCDLEMLANILEPEDASYPWNPSEEKSDEYFYELEQQFSMTDVLDEELTQRSQNFYQQIDLQWSKNLNTSYYKHSTEEKIKVNLQENLLSGFADKVPQEWLAKISSKAGELLKSGHSVGEQLIECVQAVMPTFDSEDLSVMARPYAFAMRGNENKSEQVESALKPLSDREWSSLSKIEQARVSLAMAYHAIQELSSTDS